jgi:hypothetical protein
MIAARAAKIGWTALLVAACGGAILEAMHGFKVSAYLDDDLTRTLLRLAHAHGVGLSLVVILFGVSAVPRLNERLSAHVLSVLTIALATMPLGFGLGVIARFEGDPGPAIFLVPIGAIALVYALARIAVAMWTNERE